jgi:hypothetical protein
MEPEPEPAEDGATLSGGQKLDGKLKAVTKSHAETSEYGMAGPTLRGQLLKRSQHVKEWRERYFILKDRKIFYYESEEDSQPDKDGKQYYKGYIDLVGCTVETLETITEQGDATQPIQANSHVRPQPR